MSLCFVLIFAVVKHCHHDDGSRNVSVYVCVCVCGRSLSKVDDRRRASALVCVSVSLVVRAGKRLRETCSRSVSFAFDTEKNELRHMENKKLPSNDFPEECHLTRGKRRKNHVRVADGPEKKKRDGRGTGWTRKDDQTFFLSRLFRKTFNLSTGVKKIIIYYYTFTCPMMSR